MLVRQMIDLQNNQMKLYYLIFSQSLNFIFLNRNFYIPMHNNYFDTNSDYPNYDQDHLSNFNYILSNQHSKQFHLIDSPDLIFQLSKYKFHQQKSLKPSNQPHPSYNKKIYRYKSQQETFQSDHFDKSSNFHNKNSDISYQKFKPCRISLNSNGPPFTENKPPKKIQSKTKQKSYTSKEKPKQNSLKIDLKNLTEKENLHAKILSVPRPLTSKFSDLKKLPINQCQTKSNWKKGFQRKKYSDLKGKLQNLIKTVQNCDDLNFSEVFEYQQAILKQYLESLVSQLKKQCIQKGQLIQMIWNTFFTLINKIIKMLIKKTKQSEKNQVQAQINLHEGYQQMYIYEANKIIELGKKYNESKNLIDRLVYELRYKRKQTKKLYKSLAICNQKLNQYKVEHIDLQNEHIDLLIETKKMDQNQALQILKRKLEVNKEKYIKLRVGTNKEKMKQKIKQQIEYELLDPEEEQLFKKQLCQKINAFKIKKKMSPAQEKEQQNFLQQFIQRYSNKFIENQKKNDEIQFTKNIRRSQKISVAINTDADPKRKYELTHSVTQTTFSDKLQFCLINHLSTQTPDVQKIKKCNHVQVQADGDQMKIALTKARMMAYRTMDLSFYLDVNKNQRIKTIFSYKNSQKSAKKSFIKQNVSTSDIQKDKNDSIPVVMTKKRLSKNELFKKKDKKSSIFGKSLPNYTNIKPDSQQLLNGKNDPKYKIQKKRASQMPDTFELGSQESQYKRINRLFKKRTFQSPEHSHLNPNRQSIRTSNIESLIENFSISEEKIRQLQNFIMKKDSEFEIVQQNSIFDAFKNFIANRQDLQSSKFFALYKQKAPKLMKLHNQDDSADQENENCDILQPKKSFTLFQKLKESQKEINDSIKKNHPITSSNNKSKETNQMKEQKQNLKKARFLQMIIELAIKKSLIRKKVDLSNLHACNQKQQFTSIAQKLDPLMLNLECLIDQAFINKKKTSSINIKTANKLLMNTYTRSIDKIFRSNAILQNLIRPLFECFQVIYGAMNPNEIYRKMVGFISDIMSIKQSENFREFIFFLGIDKTNPNSAHLTNFDVRLYLKLLEKLNLGGKISSQSQAVFTSKVKVKNELIEILDSQNISSEVIIVVQAKIIDMLEKLEDFVHQNMKLSEEENKINLFKVSKMIVEEIIKIRVQSMNKLEMYMDGLLNVMQTTANVKRAKKDLINIDIIKSIVECCRISTSKKLQFSKYIEELCLKHQKQQGKKIVKRSDIGVLLIRIGLVNFQGLEERIKYLEQKDTKLTNNQGIESQQNNCQINYCQFGRNLKKLACIQVQTNNILQNFLGDIMIGYQIGLIQNFQQKKDKPN